MAVTGSDAKVDETLRENFGNTLNSSDYSASVGANTSVSTSSSFFGGSNTSSLLSANDYAGIKPGFVTNLHDAITKYEEDLNGVIAKLETNVAISPAFKGTGVGGALSRLISAVKAEAISYTAAVREAEKQIITSVSEAYKAQDEAVKEQMDADTSKLGSE